jgi:hypothetical protein
MEAAVGIDFALTVMRQMPRSQMMKARTMLDTRAYDASKHGLRYLYRPAKANVCPGCGQSNWYVGRESAECAFCGTVLLLAQTALNGYMSEIQLPVAA